MKKYLLPAIMFSLAVVSGICYLIFKKSLPLEVQISLKLAPTMFMCVWMLIKKIDKSNWPIFIGLILSMACDTFMALSGTISLVGGILSNILALLLYTLYYYQSDKSLDLLRIIPILVVLGVFYFVLYDFLGSYKIPVLIYCSVYVIFLWRSAARLGDKTISRRSQYVCFLGSLLLTVSDCLLSFLMFNVLPHKEKYHYVVMLLWWGGLFMLMITAEIKRKSIS